MILSVFLTCLLTTSHSYLIQEGDKGQGPLSPRSLNPGLFAAFSYVSLAGLCHTSNCNGGWGGEYLSLLSFIVEVGWGKKEMKMVFNKSIKLLDPWVMSYH